MTPEEAALANAHLVRSYRLTFGQPHGQDVLRDLMKLCRFRVPLVDGKIEANAVLMAEGRRQVYLRIQNMMCLSDEQLAMLYRGAPLMITEDE